AAKKFTYNVVAHANNAVKLTHTLVHKLYYPHISKIVRINKINNNYVVFLFLTVAAVNSLLHFQRIIRPVIVNNKRAKLQIKAAGGYFRANKYFGGGFKLPQYFIILAFCTIIQKH